MAKIKMYPDHFADGILDYIANSPETEILYLHDPDTGRFYNVHEMKTGELVDKIIDKPWCTLFSIDYGEGPIFRSNGSESHYYCPNCHSSVNRSEDLEVCHFCHVPINWAKATSRIEEEDTP